MRIRILILALVTVAAFAWSLETPYLYDDALWLQRARQPFVWSLETPSRVLTEATYAATAAVFGFQPRAHHSVNLLIHLAVGLVLAAAVRRRVGEAGALIALVLVWWHPLNGEAVRYGVGRPDLLLALCAALMLWALIAARPWVAVLPALAACWVKEIGPIVPVLGLWTAWRLGLLKPSPWLWAGAAIVNLTVALSAVPRLLAASDVGVQTAIGGLGQQATALAQYAGMFLLPLPSLFSIDHDFIAEPMAWQLLSLAWLALLTGYAWRTRRPVARWAIGWVLLALAPRFLLGTAEPLAERQLYLPMLGVCAAVGGWLGQQWIRYAPSFSLCFSERAYDG